MTAASPFDRGESRLGAAARTLAEANRDLAALGERVSALETALQELALRQERAGREASALARRLAEHEDEPHQGDEWWDDAGVDHG